MFLTKECGYAIRLVRCLADSEKKSVKEICTYTSLPRPFAYKILKKLEHKGIVAAYRGLDGGYQLTKAPDAVTLYDIVTAVDENVALIECLQPGYECPLDSDGKRCVIRQELVRIQEMLVNALEEKTIEDIL